MRSTASWERLRKGSNGDVGFPAFRESVEHFCPTLLRDELIEVSHDFVAPCHQGLDLILIAAVPKIAALNGLPNFRTTWSSKHPDQVSGICRGNSPDCWDPV